MNGDRLVNYVKRAQMYWAKHKLLPQTHTFYLFLVL